MPSWNWQKIKKKLNNTLRLNFCYLKTFLLCSSTLSSKNNRIYKKCAKYKCACFTDVIRLMTIKVRLKMKNRLQRYNINRPKPRHRSKYTNYKMYISIMPLYVLSYTLKLNWWKSQATLRLTWKKALLIKKRVHSYFFH